MDGFLQIAALAHTKKLFHSNVLPDFIFCGSYFFANYYMIFWTIRKDKNGKFTWGEKNNEFH